MWRNEAITVENPDDFRVPLEEARKPGKSDPRTNQILREMIAAGTVQAEDQARNREYRLSE